MKTINHFPVLDHYEFNPKSAAYLRTERVIKRLICLILTCFGLVSFALAQSRQVVNQSIQWSFLSSTIKFSPRYSLFTEQQMGFAEYRNMQHVFRAGMEYTAIKKLAIIPFGYAYTWNYIYGKQPATFVNNEHTLWQQIVYKQTISRVALSHRLRSEERYIQTHSMTANSDVVNNGFNNRQFRLRYRAQVNIPLNRKKIEPKTFFLSLWDEIFMSWGRVVTYHKPDQNRLFTGVGYQFTKSLTMQTGFYYQMLVKSNGLRQENNTGLLFQLNYNFDLSK